MEEIDNMSIKDLLGLLNEYVGVYEELYMHEIEDARSKKSGEIKKEYISKFASNICKLVSRLSDMQSHFSEHEKSIFKTHLLNLQKITDNAEKKIHKILNQSEQILKDYTVVQEGEKSNHLREISKNIAKFAFQNKKE